jgi:hypothetical protein
LEGDCAAAALEQAKVAFVITDEGEVGSETRLLQHAEGIK